MPLLAFCIALAQVGAPSAVARRCGRDWDMVSVAGHTLRASFLDHKLHTHVNKFSTPLMCYVVPLQLVEDIPCPSRSFALHLLLYVWWI